jgi:exonuclease SbcC
LKIHDLRITGIGPYAATEEIDFEGLNRAGVVLLSGPTGSGKTTILDAVCFAIFGQIPRSASGEDVVSDHRDPESADAPEVVLDFTVGGRRFRVTRRPKYQRPSRRSPDDDAVEEKKFVKLESLVSGVWQDESSGWTETNNRLTELIGMSADQFHQLVLLPQGKFARFLESKVDERKALLETLFPGSDLSFVEEWLKRRAKQDADARTAKMQEISDCLQQAWPPAVALSDELEAEGGERLGELPAHDEPGPVADWTAQVAEKLESRAAAAEEARRKSSLACTEAETRLGDAKHKLDLIGQRKKAEAKVRELGEKKPWREETGRRIEAADRAAPLVPLIREARRQTEEAESCGRKASEIAAVLREEELAGTDDEPALREICDDARNQAATISNFERDDLPRRRELEAGRPDLDAEIQKLAGGSQELEDKQRAVAEAESAKSQAKMDLIEVRKRRTAGMARELAAGLTPGNPCPVCGATEHPGAEHDGSEPVSEDDEARAQELSDQREAALTEAQRALEDAKAEERSRLEARRRDLKVLDEALGRLRETEAGLCAGEVTLATRREKLEAVVEKIEEFFTASRKARDADEAARTAGRTAAEGLSGRGFDDETAAEAAWIDAPDLAALRNELNEYDAQLNAARGLLEGGLQEVDTGEQVDLEPLEQAAKAAVEVRDRDVGRASTSRERRDTFASVTGPIPGLFDELRPLREAAARSKELHRLAAGDNEKRMKLSTYVLAVRLRQVIQAANQHLRRMSDGRYELVYSGDVTDARSNAGLDIRVYDSNTSDTRSTGTFSGGESFYASLALALGLAEVVQQESGGRPLETLFIDEGFGTLDSKTLEQVMDVIDELREGGRTVGLVSHVDELKSRITARIEVKPGRTGSTLEVVGV